MITICEQTNTINQANALHETVDRPMPSMFVPNDHAVITLPKMAAAMPRSRMMPPQRAWRMAAFQITIISAPFSLGSQPQNRPHD